MIENFYFRARIQRAKNYAKWFLILKQVKKKSEEYRIL